MNLRTIARRAGSIPKPERNLAIDRLRGLLVMLMVVGDYLGGIEWVPAWLKHAPDIGLTIADVVAPAFVFVIGLNFGDSFSRHLTLGNFAAYRHFLWRYLTLLGIGAILSTGAAVVGQSVQWGVLQALGVAGLIGLLFIRVPTWWRLAIGFVILIVYQFLLDTYLLENVLGSSHGGPFGAVAWGAMLVLSTVFADIWRKGMIPYSLASVALVALAAISTTIVPVSKNRVSLSFVLTTLATSALAYLIFEVASKGIRRTAGVFCWWGENALVLYLLHLMLLAIFVLPPVGWWHSNVSPWLGLLQLIVIFTVMTATAFWLHRRRLY